MPKKFQKGADKRGKWKRPKKVKGTALATPEVWAEIRRAYEHGMSYKQLEEVYKIKYGTLAKRSCVERWIKPANPIKQPRKPAILRPDALQNPPTAQEAINMTLGDIKIAHEVPVANWLHEKTQESQQFLEAPQNWKEYIAAQKLLRSMLGLDKPQIAIAINPFGISAQRGSQSVSADGEDWEEIEIEAG